MPLGRNVQAEAQHPVGEKIGRIKDSCFRSIYICIFLEFVHGKFQIGHQRLTIEHELFLMQDQTWPVCGLSSVFKQIQFKGSI